MKRERQFEVMRTIAMFFIVIYHILTHGVGSDVVFNASSPVSMTNILFSDFLLVFSSISVNLYVMVSGYFLADLDFKMNRIVRIWAQACFYSCVITIVMTIMKPKLMLPFLCSLMGLGSIVAVIALITVGWLIIRKIIKIDV